MLPVFALIWFVVKELLLAGCNFHWGWEQAYLTFQINILYPIWFAGDIV